MIQIIKGTFGYYNGRKVIPITEADGPQKFDDELEARLVKEGVAKYIGEQGETAEQTAPTPGDDADEPASTNTAADEAPEYDEDMKLDELKEVAARYGVDASAMRKKADVIAAIEAAKAEQPEEVTELEEVEELPEETPAEAPAAEAPKAEQTPAAEPVKAEEKTDAPAEAAPVADEAAPAAEAAPAEEAN